MDRLQEALISTALDPSLHDFNLDILYGSESDAQDVLACCRSFPMMAQHRIVIVRGFEQLKGKEHFARYAKEPNPTAIVALLCGIRPRLNANPYRELKRNAASVEFRALYDNQVAGFIRRHLSALDCTITPDGAAVLADYVGTSLHTVANEIEKLRTFAGKRTELTREDVILASGQTREFNVFQLQRALGEGRVMDVQRIAQHILSAASNKHGEALRLIAMLYSFIRKLWMLHGLEGQRLSPGEQAKVIGVLPTLLREYKQAQRRTSRHSLENAFASLLAADYEIKGGARRHPKLVITLLLRRLFTAFGA